MICRKNCSSSSRSLRNLGENVIKANSGAEALRLVLANDFAVILLDVYMPGMNGFETAALIRQRRKSAHTPIIFITAFADEMHTAQGYSLGAVDYILSPIVPEILRTKVKVFVDLYRMTQQVKQQADERVSAGAGAGGARPPRRPRAVRPFSPRPARCCPARSITKRRCAASCVCRCRIWAT